MKKEYPGILDRIKAITGDTFIFVVLLYLTAIALASFEQLPSFIKPLCIALICILYDPLMVAFTGGTIGHKMVGIHVKKESDETKNIPFHLALLRFIIKATLGWVAFLSIGANARNRAIHDLASGSVVLYEKKNN
ncbi:MAG: RDD family protein [Flavobacteriales bacterium]